MSIGFYLMTEKGLKVLESVIQSFGAKQVEYVIEAGEEGMANDYRDAIAALCRQHGIRCFDRKDAFQPTADYHFAVSWRWMIHDAAGLIVLHDSLLPKYRGFAPLPTALINGDPYVGVTALFASNEYDRGDILDQRKLAVTYPAKIQTMISALSAEYADLVIDICRRIQAGAKLTGTPQNEAEASYSLWRDEEDYRIDWSSDAERIKRFIDSVGSPYKGASAFMGEHTVRILDAVVEPDIQIEVRQPGKVVFLREGYPIVVCGRGLLRITVMRDDTTTGRSVLPLKKLRTRFT